MGLDGPVDAEGDEHGPAAAHEDAGEQARGVDGPVDHVGHELAAVDGQRADDDDGQRNHDHERHQRRDDELEVLRHDVVKLLVQPAVGKASQDGGHNGGAVAHEHHGDAEEVGHGAVARVAHKSHEIGVDQRAANERCDVGVGLEALGRGDEQQHRQQVEDGACRGEQDRVGGATLGEQAQLGEQNDEAAQDARAGKRCQDGREDARDGGEDLVDDALVARRRLGVELRLARALNQRLELLVELGHLDADEDLVLSRRTGDVGDAVDGLDHGIVDDGLVTQVEAKPRCAVGHAGHVLRSPDLLKNLSCAAIFAPTCRCPRPPLPSWWLAASGWTRRACAQAPSSMAVSRRFRRCSHVGRYT